MNNSTFAICAKCKHHRQRSSEQLFGLSDLQIPGVLKAQIEWEQQEQERRLLEVQLFDSGQEFKYEPHYYAWCAVYTPSDKVIKSAQDGNENALKELEKNGGATLNPVTGETMRVYALCARMNPNGRCPLFIKTEDR